MIYHIGDFILSHLVYVCYCGGLGLGHPEAVTVLTSESALLRAERERLPYSAIVLIHAQWAVRLQPLASRFLHPPKSTDEVKNKNITSNQLVLS